MLIDDNLVSGVMLRVVRNDGNEQTQARMKRAVTLASVRNRDQMSVASMLDITDVDVRSILAEAKRVVCEIVPSRDRWWQNNRDGVLASPLAICAGMWPSVLIVDNSKGSLLHVDNHSPNNVSTLLSGLKKPIAIAYLKAVVYISTADGNGVLMCAADNLICQAWCVWTPWEGLCLCPRKCWLLSCVMH